MRTITLTILTAALIGCGSPSATGLQHAGSTPFGGNRLANTLAGKGAGLPMTCLPSGRWTSQSLEGGGFAFQSGRQVFVGTFVGGCPQAEQPGIVMVSKGIGPSACEGDFVQAVDSSTGRTLGHCVMGPFIPYELGRKWQ